MEIRPIGFRGKRLSLPIWKGVLGAMLLL